MRSIDKFLNNITMYRLLLFILTFYLIIAALFGFMGILPYSVFSIASSATLLVFVSLITNKVFSKVFHAITNYESVYITALILALIITPAKSFTDYMFLLWAGVLSMASKYLIAINKKHIFNPAAFAVALTALVLNESASWWIGTSVMFPFVLIGGYLIVKKIKRWDMFLYSILATLTLTLGYSLMRGNNLVISIRELFLNTALVFFSTVMLTEPLTTPPTEKLRSLYGAITGILFTPQLILLGFSPTPEIALLIGNVFSYLVSPKEKLILNLKEKLQIAPDIYDYIFTPKQKLSYVPGQYMEWTLPMDQVDDRGNRRYFTLASSPTEKDLRLGIKFYPEPSYFKANLFEMENDDEIVASQLSGDFTLPKNKKEKLVFIAGGIGVTPFRSMIKYLMDKGEKRDIVILYSVKKESDLVYKEIFEKACEDLGIKIIYVVTSLGQHINKELIEAEVPDYKNRLFYISGPLGMIDSFKDILNDLDIKSDNIKTDYFPGFT